MNHLPKFMVIEGGKDTKPHHSSPISSELAGLGLSSVTASLEATDNVLRAMPEPSAILFQIPSGKQDDSYESFKALAKRLRSDAQTSNIPLLMVEPTNNAQEVSDKVIPVARLSSHLQKKVAIAMRLRRMEEELERRLKTLSSITGVKNLKIKRDDTQLRALFVNFDKSQPDLQAAFDVMGVDQFYCSLNQFEQNVAQISPDLVLFQYCPQHSISLTAQLVTMRANTRYALLPFMVLAVPSHQRIMFRRTDDPLTETFDPSAQASFLAERSVLRGREYRQRHDVARGLRGLGREDIYDDVTGFYKPAFFKHHLRQLIKSSNDSLDPLTLVVLRIFPQDTKYLPAQSVLLPEQMRRSIALMMNQVLRPEDFCTEISKGVFMLGLLATDIAKAEAPLRRICGIIRGTRFQNEDNAYQLDVTSEMLCLENENMLDAFVAEQFDAKI